MHRDGAYFADILHSAELAISYVKEITFEIEEVWNTVKNDIPELIKKDKRNYLRSICSNTYMQYLPGPQLNEPLPRLCCGK